MHHVRDMLSGRCTAARHRYAWGVLLLVVFGTGLALFNAVHGTYDLLEMTSTPAYSTEVCCAFVASVSSHPWPAGRQPALFEDVVLRQMNDPARVMSYYPHKAAPQSQNKTQRWVPEEDISLSQHKVVYIIVDGLRYDCTSGGESLVFFRSSSPRMQICGKTRSCGH